MKRRFILWLLALLAVAACTKENAGEEHDVVDESNEAVVFSNEQGRYDGLDLLYRRAVIHGDIAGDASLVLYLHGGSSRGNDNEAQMNEKGIDSISNYLVAHNIKSVFLVPQCPSDKSWGGTMNAVLKELIDEYITQWSVSTNKIYIFGGSMGGTGTWSMLSAYPNVFAAAMPVAGNPSGSDANEVAKTPLYTVIGTADAIMDVPTVTDFVNRLTALGNENKYDLVEGRTHEVTCVESYTGSRLAWVFGHTKSATKVSR